MRPDFSNIDFKKLPQNPTDFRQWEKDNNIISSWMTSEQIPVKQVYGADDLLGMVHRDHRSEYIARYQILSCRIARQCS